MNKRFWSFALMMAVAIGTYTATQVAADYQGDPRGETIFVNADTKQRIKSCKRSQDIRFNAGDHFCLMNEQNEVLGFYMVDHTTFVLAESERDDKICWGPPNKRIFQAVYIHWLRGPK